MTPKGVLPLLLAFSAGAADKIEEGNTNVECVDTGSDGHITFDTEGSERMRVDSSGDVEIGQTKYLTWTHSFGGTHRGRISCFANDSMVFENGSGDSEQMRITSNGNVGIGTSNPVQQAGKGLHIYNGSGQSRLKISNNTVGSTANDGTDFIAEENTDFHIINHENGALKFGTNDAERMRLNSSGSLQIGGSANTGSQLLQVQGNSNSTSDVIICNSVASSGQQSMITFAPANNITGARIIATAEEDFSVGANRTARMEFHTRKDGSLSEKARITPEGRLLLGHSSLTGDGDSANSRLVVNGNTVATSKGGILSLENTATAISSVNNGNQIGQLFFKTETGEEFGLIKVEATQNATSSSCPARMIFSTTATNATTPTERMRINQTGVVLIGKTGENHNNNGVELKANSGGNGQVVATNAGLCIRVNRHTSTGEVIQMMKSGTIVGRISVSGSSTTYSTTSDYRLKENVVNLDGAIDRVKQLTPKRFNFITEPDETVDGFLAHEAQTVVPEAVIGTHNEVDDDGNAVMQEIDQSKLVPLLTAALQEAITKIETLETQNASLEARLTALEGGS